MGLGMTLHLGGGELEAPMSLRAYYESPPPSKRINQHSFIHSTDVFLRAAECGSLEHELEIGEIWP